MSVNAHQQLDDGARILQFPSSGPARSRDRSAAVDRMAEATMRLARRNEALEDFAALVAHELKTPLEAALLADDPHHWIASALDLVESLLRSATESASGAWASLPECLAEAARCVHSLELVVVVDERGHFPLPPGSLSVILRNLLANAAAAKAHRVNVFTTHRRREWSVVVDDDGVGVDGHDGAYAHGSGIGLELCRRLAERSGGRLELLPRHAGGTRAILTVEQIP